MNLCLEGSSSIPERQKLLTVQKELLLNQIEEIHKSIDYINNKQKFFDGVMAGEIKYTSNLIDDRMV